MAVEGMKTIFDWVAVILLFLTFAAGLGALITGNIINKQQAAKLKQFDSDLTESKTKFARQQERAAIAERELLTLQQRVEPRKISPELANLMVERLRSFQGQKLQLVWFISSPEIINFASEIQRVLVAAGWSVFPAPVQRSNDIPVGVCFSTLNSHSKRPSLLALEDVLGAIIPISRCNSWGGVLPFAQFQQPDGRTVGAANVDPDEVISLWIGSKP